MVEEIKIICETIKSIATYAIGAWVLVSIIRGLFGK